MIDKEIWAILFSMLCINKEIREMNEKLDPPIP